MRHKDGQIIVKELDNEFECLIRGTRQFCSRDREAESWHQQLGWFQQLVAGILLQTQLPRSEFSQVHKP